MGDQLTFWGGIDTRYVLPSGTCDEVRCEVQRRLDDLATDGGYVLAAVHDIQAEVPPKIFVRCSMRRTNGESKQQPRTEIQI